MRPITASPARVLCRSAIVGVAALLMAGCAGPKQTAGGEVFRTDELAMREREAYDLARQAAAAQKAGNTQKAIELYRRSVALGTDIPSAWNNLGLLLMEESNYMDAVEAFKIAARQDTTDPRPLINIGVAYDRTGWAEQALDAYLQALERRATERDALLGAIGANHRLLGADRASLERVKAALLIEPDPDTRTWLERERFRIESRLAANSRTAPMIPAPTAP